MIVVLDENGELAPASEAYRLLMAPTDHAEAARPQRGLVCAASLSG